MRGNSAGSLNSSRHPRGTRHRDTAGDFFLPHLSNDWAVWQKKILDSVCLIRVFSFCRGGRYCTGCIHLLLPSAGAVALIKWRWESSRRPPSSPRHPLCHSVLCPVNYVSHRKPWTSHDAPSPNKGSAESPSMTDMDSRPWPPAPRIPPGPWPAWLPGRMYA